MVSPSATRTTRPVIEALCSASAGGVFASDTTAAKQNTAAADVLINSISFRCAAQILIERLTFSFATECLGFRNPSVKIMTASCQATQKSGMILQPPSDQMRANRKLVIKDLCNLKFIFGHWFSAWTSGNYLLS